MTRTGQTIYMEVVVEEITIIKVFRKFSMETALEEAVFKIVDLIINIIYYYHPFDKRSAIYIGNLDAN